MRKNRYFWAYLVCGTLFFIWQTSNSLAIYYMPALTEILYSVFAAHYVAGGIGIIAAGLLCDKIIRADKSRRLFAAALAAVSGLCTLSLCFIADATLYIAVFVIGTLLGFGVNGVLLGGLFVALPQGHKALGFGLAFALNVLLRLPIDLAIANGAANNVEYSGFAAAAMLLLLAALFIKPVAQSFSIQIEEGGREPMGISKDAGLMWIAVACGTAVYVSFGIFDRLTSATPFYMISMLSIRLTQSLSAVAAGFICMRFGYYTSFISSVSFLGIGTLAYLFGWSGAIGVICGCATFTGFSLFYHPLRAVFAEIGKRGKYPYTVAAFGFALYFITQVIGIPIADLMDSVGKEAGTVIFVALFMLSIPLIILLFHRLRNAYSAGQTLPSSGAADIAHKDDAVDALPLTRREKQILRLILQRRVSREIAETLFVSESTINWHVGNILNKTGAANRAELIDRFKGKVEWVALI